MSRFQFPLSIEDSNSGAYNDSTQSNIKIDSEESPEEPDTEIFLYGTGPIPLIGTDVAGKGACASVILGTMGTDNVAIKSVSIYRPTQLYQLINEVILLPKFMDCKEIVDMRCAYYKNGELSVVLEHMECGSLDKKIGKATKTLSEESLRIVAYDCIRGLMQLHRKSIIHRDIKPGNILVDAEGQVKICDFGLAKELTDSERSSSEVVGTQKYISPEQISTNTDAISYGPLVDIWALGLTLLNLSIGHEKLCPDERCKDVFGLKNLHKDIEHLITLDKKCEISETFQSFLRCCLASNPKNRWSAEYLFNHPFIANIQESDINDTRQKLVTELKPSSVVDGTLHDTDDVSGHNAPLQINDVHTLPNVLNDGDMNNIEQIKQIMNEEKGFLRIINTGNNIELYNALRWLEENIKDTTVVTYPKTTQWSEYGLPQKPNTKLATMSESDDDNSTCPDTTGSDKGSSDSDTNSTQEKEKFENSLQAKLELIKILVVMYTKKKAWSKFISKIQFKEKYNQPPRPKCKKCNRRQRYNKK